MRCMACDVILSDGELTLRTPEEAVFADLCYKCYDASFGTDFSNDVPLDESIEAGIDIEGVIKYEQDW